MPWRLWVPLSRSVAYAPTIELSAMSTSTFRLCPPIVTWRTPGIEPSARSKRPGPMSSSRVSKSTSSSTRRAISASWSIIGRIRLASCARSGPASDAEVGQKSSQRTTSIDAQRSWGSLRIARTNSMPWPPTAPESNTTTCGSTSRILGITAVEKSAAAIWTPWALKTWASFSARSSSESRMTTRAPCSPLRSMSLGSVAAGNVESRPPLVSWNSYCRDSDSSIASRKRSRISSVLCAEARSVSTTTGMPSITPAGGANAQRSRSSCRWTRGRRRPAGCFSVDLARHEPCSLRHLVRELSEPSCDGVRTGAARNDRHRARSEVTAPRA